MRSLTILINITKFSVHPCVTPPDQVCSIYYPPQLSALYVASVQVSPTCWIRNMEATERSEGAASGWGLLYVLIPGTELLPSPKSRLTVPMSICAACITTQGVARLTSRWMSTEAPT